MNKTQWHTRLLFKLVLLGSIASLVAACGGTVTPPPQVPTSPPPTKVPETEGNVITVVGDNWCPYNCDPGSEHPGYMIEIATEVFKKAGYQLKYESVPWSRVVMGIEDGTYDGGVGAAKGDIPGAIFSEEEMGYILNSMFVRKGEQWQYAGLDSLKSIRLGVIGDYYYTDELNAYIEANPNNPQVDVMRGDNAVERSLTKLLENKIDVYIEDPNVVTFTAADMGLDMNKLAIAGKLNEPQGVYIAFSPKNPQSAKWAEILSQGIKELRQSGRLAEILKWYGLKDWK